MFQLGIPLPFGREQSVNKCGGEDEFTEEPMFYHTIQQLNSDDL